MNNESLLNYSIKEMKKQGADKAQATLVLSEKHELNTELNKIKLFRSTDDVTLTFTFIREHRKASTTINDVSESAIDEAIKKLVVLSDSAPIDEANDIADFDDEQSFSVGILEPDLNLVYDALVDFTNEMKTEFKKISGDMILSYDYKKKYVRNSNGLSLQEAKGNYNFMMMFAAKEGDKITSFNYTGGSTLDLKRKLTDVGMLGDLMHQTVEELEAKPFEGKFIGDVIITPLCLESFLGQISSAALSDGALIAGSSMLKDKIGEVIAVPEFTWHSNPRSKELASGFAITSDGFVAKNLTIVKNGVLKTHLLSQYGANKMGVDRSNNYGGAFELEPGKATLEEMIRNVTKGVLLCRFSGGRPGADGGFAGVAKNSFYIENGKIQYPMSETMISGNLFEILKNIKSISSKRVNFGSCILPWIHTTGTTISGQ